ncbi:hypothetical protein NQ318_003502 [Aromia moschata]|uniref:HSF-type DNA-binding domain-containing protein n=1 Tax=Aromia moschata TaxID=1265417 RepID=A0AAV8YV37_9CUCU|nr:hypothetical protein NQ318_003502 [Aromia moschata]
MQPIGENTANIPAFLGKLWKMVNDPNTNHLICWSPAGNSFVIQNQAQFWYELLPLYYKHNNMSSFSTTVEYVFFCSTDFIKCLPLRMVQWMPIRTRYSFIILISKKTNLNSSRILNERRVTGSKTSENNVQNIIKHDDIAKVLTDVKQLRGRQSSVHSQLSSMKQENAVLWRELALLRQKHIKQQQIVNKLIQFLVTLVQPSATSRMGVGVKRRMPLMLHESPTKKPKTKKLIQDNSDNGPTIHELDSEIEILPEGLLEQDVEESPLVSSPLAATTSPSGNSNEVHSQPPSCSSDDDNAEAAIPENFWDKPEFVEISQLHPDDLMMSDNDLVEESINDLQSNANQANEKVFLNPTARDTLLSNLVNGSYNSNILNGKNSKKINNGGTENASNMMTNVVPGNNSDMTVATRDIRINNVDDLDLHLDHTQSEIDQLKDILHGCNSLDANALLGLFNDEAPGYGLTCNQNKDDMENTPTDAQETPTSLPDTSSTVNTPLVVKSEPIFPNLEKEL